MLPRRRLDGHANMITLRQQSGRQTNGEDFRYATPERPFVVTGGGKSSVADRCFQHLHLQFITPKFHQPPRRRGTGSGQRSTHVHFEEAAGGGPLFCRQGHRRLSLRRCAVSEVALGFSTARELWSLPRATLDDSRFGSRLSSAACTEVQAVRSPEIAN